MRPTPYGIESVNLPVAALPAPMLFEHLFDAAADAIVLVDNRDRVVRINPAFERMFGYRAEECEGRSLNKLIVEPGLEQEASAISGQVLTGKSVRVESLRRTRDGKTLHVEISGVPIHSQAGQVGIFGIYRDVTERVATTRALQDAETAYRVMAQNTGQLVYDFDLRTGAIRWHGAVEAVLGCSPAATAAIDIHEWERRIHPDDRKHAVALLERAQEKGERYRAEYRFHRTDGATAIVSDSGSFLLDGDGNAVRMIGTMTDITERRRIERRVRWQARHDPLTGLYNRHKFQADGEALLAEPPGRDDRPGDGHCLLYIDLDQFKIINDTCGHPAGDDLLRQVAELLGASVRRSDLLARLGGDEFALLLRDCPPSRAEKVAESLITNIEGHPFTWEGHRFQIGASVGLVAIEPGRTLKDALRRADQACYIAKEKGRNQVHIYRDNDAHSRAHGSQVRAALEVADALDEDRFRLYFQNIRLLGREDPGRHCEILVRMLGRDGRMIPPGEFIPGAERFNRITRLDRWVVAQTLAGLARARTAGCLGGRDRISINLSGATFGQPQFLDFVQEQFAQTGVDPANVCFEITESSAISRLSDALAFIRTVRAMGCSICLDDFGSGFSSFGYLKMLPVDGLKIDGTLVRGIDESPLGRAMVRGIIEIAHAGGIPCVAEQVESAAHRDLLLDMGVDYIQGFLIHRPEPWPFGPGAHATGDATDISSR